jgi:hypothetical protein
LDNSLTVNSRKFPCGRGSMGSFKGVSSIMRR